MASLVAPSSAIVAVGASSMRFGVLRKSSAAVPQRAAPTSYGLTSSFTALRPAASFSSSSLAGLAFRPSLQRFPTVQRGGLVVVRAKVAIGCTKRSRSRKAIARLSGFRKRMSTATGRRVIRKRRAKGRKVLAPASNPNSGKFA